MEIDSLEYECWHEVGHAVICLTLGGNVEFIEILEKKDSPGRAKASCRVNQSIRRDVACGGFAAEYFLYLSGFLNVSEKQFLDAAFDNAAFDRISFFGANHKQENGRWPQDLDEQFLLHARDYVFPLIKENIQLIQELVSLLKSTKRIDTDQIQEVLKKHKKSQKDERLCRMIKQYIFKLSKK